jgi:hypothetical protein
MDSLYHQLTVKLVYYYYIIFIIINDYNNNNDNNNYDHNNNQEKGMMMISLFKEDNTKISYKTNYIIFLKNINIV